MRTAVAYVYAALTGWFFAAGGLAGISLRPVPVYIPAGLVVLFVVLAVLSYIIAHNAEVSAFFVILVFVPAGIVAFANLGGWLV